MKRKINGFGISFMGPEEPLDSPLEEGQLYFVNDIEGYKVIKKINGEVNILATSKRAEELHALIASIYELVLDMEENREIIKAAKSFEKSQRIIAEFS